MVAVQINEYDGGASGGDGNLTQRTLPADGDSANDRVTGMEYDWRNRLVQITAPQDNYTVNTLDTMDRVTRVDRYAQATGTLIGRADMLFDDRGQAYQAIRYAVDISTGDVGNSLVSNTWFDPAGNVVCKLPAGSSLFTKSAIDGAGRTTATYAGYYLGTKSYSWAGSVTDDTIMEQVETAYDDASNVIQTTSRRRFHNATGTGPLTEPGGEQPMARVSFVASYPDGVGRTQAVADYGTNGDETLDRPDTIPARADTLLVSGTLYNARGEPNQTVDPAAKVDQTTLDDAARRTVFIDNYQPTTSSSSSPSSSSGGLPTSDDTNVTTRWTHNADDLVATITAVNAETGDQVTTNVWGTTLGTSDIARNDLRAGVNYPDGGIVSSLFNRQNQAKETTDQRGVVHGFDFDLLGRQVQDRVIATEPTSSSSTSGTGNSSGSSSSSGVPSGVDTTVLRLATTYDVRGMVQGKTSYDNPTVGEGTVVNDVQRVFNDFSQISTEYQEHTGAVNTATSPAVGYQYADGSTNTIRQTGMTYPNGRVLYADYGASGGIDDALSRVASLIDDDGTTHLADYTRIGLAGIVQVESPEPQIAWSLINGDGADPYTGLDRFDRVVDNRWFSTATSDDLDRIQHGYDRAGNRLWRKAPVAAAAGANLDELYAYDGVYRLGDMQRGELNGTQTAITTGTENFAQAWGLDATGNWGTFLEDDTGGGAWSLNQTRTHTEFNEIESITGGGWVQPAYDLAGNMTTMPQPSAPAADFDGVYDAWNRMVSIWSGGSAVGVYRFDGINRRVSKLVSGALRDIFYTTAWQAIEEWVGGSLDRQFVCGLRYIDDLVLRDRGTERLFGIQDPPGHHFLCVGRQRD